MSKTLAVSVLIGAALSKSYLSTFDTAEQKSAKLGQAYSETNNKLNAANAVLKYREQLKTLHQKQDAVGGSSERLAADIEKTERKYKEAKKAAKDYQLSIKGLAVEQRRLSRESDHLQTKIKHTNGLLESQSKLGALKGKALGMLGGAYAAGKMFGNAFDVEDKVLQLGDVITGENVQQRLQASIANSKAFAKKSLATETDMLEIDYSLRSSGLNDQAAMFGAQIVSKVATVTKGSASEVGFIIGDTFMNMGKQMEGSVEQKLTRIGDVFTKTKNLFSIKDFGQLGEGLKEALSGALSNNLSLEQTAAIIGQINNGMLKGSQAGTGFNAILRQLPKAADDLGFDIVRDDNGALDMLATLTSLKSALADIDDIDERSMLLQKAFGDEGKKGLMPLLSGLDDLKKNYKELNENAAGTVDEGYERRLASASGQWTIFTQNITMVGASLASTLLPAVNAVVTPVAQLVGWVAEAIEKFPVVGYIIGGLSAGIGLYGVGIAAVTAAQWLFNAALLANPIGLVVAGVVAGAAIIYSYWTPISNFFVGLWADLKSGGGHVGQFLKNVFNYSPLGIVVTNWSSVSGFFSGMWSDIQASAGNAWKFVTTIFEYSPLGLLMKGWGKAFDWIQTKFDGVGNIVSKVKDWFSWGDDEDESTSKTQVKPVTKTTNVIQLSDYRESRERGVTAKSKPVTQAVNQQLNPLAIPQPGALNQVIDQQLKPVDIASPTALGQQIDQQLNPVAIPQPGALQQVIDQQLNPVDVVNPVTLQQVIDQQLNAVDILQPGAINQVVDQQLKPVDIASPTALGQQIDQQLNPVAIPQPGALQQVIDQQLNPVDIVNPVALQQVIDQQLNAVDILQPGDITQKVQQQLQPLQPVLPDNVVQFVQPINKGKPDNAPQSVPTNYPSHGNAALQIQPQQQAAAATNIVNHNNYHITINQQPGEDAQALTDRIIRELKRRDAASKRGGLYDHG